MSARKYEVQKDQAASFLIKVAKSKYLSIAGIS